MDALVILPIRLCGLDSSDVFNSIAFVMALLRLARAHVHHVVVGRNSSHGEKGLCMKMRVVVDS